MSKKNDIYIISFVDNFKIELSAKDMVDAKKKAEFAYTKIFDVFVPQEILEIKLK